ncbi:MAG: hypothetical protein ABWK53_05205 [Anaerolineales bacterium]
MPKPKADGVVETVRYTEDGKIALVRLYERHGATWSDVVLIDRPELIRRLRQGRRIFAGRRKPYLGGVFETGARLVWLEQDGRQAVVTEGQTGERDWLAGVPIF